jgi:hypothetical protein
MVCSFTDEIEASAREHSSLAIALIAVLRKGEIPLDFSLLV